MDAISKCRNSDCPSRNLCYRFTSPPSGWQSYSSFGLTPEDKSRGKDKCDYFYPQPSVGEKLEVQGAD